MSKPTIDAILEQTKDMSTEDLQTLAERIADQANARRPTQHGNRAFTFVSTHLDSTFPHPLFYNKEKVPTNAELRRNGVPIKALHWGSNERIDSILHSVVFGDFGRPMANLRTRSGDLWPADWDSTNHGWRMSPP